MREVPDILAANLNIVFIGFNPGKRSAETGHHFAGHSNRFWKLLAQAGLTPTQLSPEQDHSLLVFGCGITNIVARPSRTAAEITRAEYAEGRAVLLDKLLRYAPKIACYAGIGVYKEFTGRKQITCGRQIEPVIPSVIDFVVPSPSGLNRISYQEQLAYYQQLCVLVQE